MLGYLVYSHLRSEPRNLYSFGVFTFLFPIAPNLWLINSPPSPTPPLLPKATRMLGPLRLFRAPDGGVRPRITRDSNSLQWFLVQLDFHPPTHDTRNLYNHPQGCWEIAIGFSEIDDNFHTFFWKKRRQKFQTQCFTLL